MTVFSLGYEGRSAPELVGLLVERGIDVLVDVRLRPISRKPGLSKKALAAALTEAGITYVHDERLGNPRENWEGFRAGEPEARERYRQHLLGEGRDALHELASRATTSNVAVLCFERDEAGCHRRIILEELGYLR